MFKTKSMSINIDGMDQQTTQIPSFAYKDKDTEDGLTQVHLTGEVASLTLVNHGIFTIERSSVVAGRIVSVPPLPPPILL